MSNSLSHFPEPPLPDQLFSHIDTHVETDGIQLKPSPGSLLNSISLIAGTTVGAGILALPAATLPAGLLPSTVLLLAAWLYMVVTGLLLAEANLQVMAHGGQPYAGFLATVGYWLGRKGAIAATVLYGFNHYALLVAYSARGGDILASALNGAIAALSQATHWPALSRWPLLPEWAGHLLFVALLGSLLYGARERFIGRLNSLLLGVVLVSFVGLLGLMFTGGNGSLSLTAGLSQWRAASAAAPVMLVAFVYQNVVPVVTTQLEGNRQKVRQAIIVGSALPLLMFLAWNTAILGAMGNSLPKGVFDPLEQLRSGLEGPVLGLAVAVFSEFAIATSFIGFVYGLLNIFEDIASHSSALAAPKPLRYALVLVPPVGFSVLSAQIFFQAIDWAGAFGVSILFGLIPGLIAWRQWPAPKIALRGVAAGVMAIACAVFLEQFAIQSGIWQP